MFIFSFCLEAKRKNEPKSGLRAKAEAILLVAKATKSKMRSAVDGEQPSRNPPTDTPFANHLYALALNGYGLRLISSARAMLHIQAG